MARSDSLRKALAGFMLGAAGMFATMYSTQAILPELSRTFDVSPSRAGLSISVVVLAVAVGGFVWGPVSDRIGRPRAIRLASLLLVPPTIGVALAPGFEALLVCRILQGLCMPGLLDRGCAVRRRGVRAADRRAGDGVLRVGARRRRPRRAARGRARERRRRLACRDRRARRVPAGRGDRDAARACPSPPCRRAAAASARHLRNVRLLGVAIGAGALFFTFVGCFTYITYRLEEPPFSYSVAAASLVFLLWLTGLVGAAHRAARRAGRLAPARARHDRCSPPSGLLLTLPDVLPLLVLGLGVHRRRDVRGR